MAQTLQPDGTYVDTEPGGGMTDTLGSSGMVAADTLARWTQSEGPNPPCENFVMQDPAPGPDGVPSTVTSINDVPGAFTGENCSAALVQITSERVGTPETQAIADQMKFEQQISGGGN